MGGRGTTSGAGKGARQSKPVKGYSTLAQMSDKDAAELITKAVETARKGNYVNTFQALLESLNAFGKPKIVPDEELENIQSNQAEIYRGVYANENAGISADDVAVHTMYGDAWLPSSKRNAFYGSGLYFSGDFMISKDYGNNQEDARMMRAKIAKDAKGVTWNELTDMINNEHYSSNKSEVFKVLESSVDTGSYFSIYAMRKGYDYIVQPENEIHNVLNRSKLVFSKKVINPHGVREWNGTPPKGYKWQPQN